MSKTELLTPASTARYAHVLDNFLLQVAGEVSKDIAECLDIPANPATAT